ncbi:MAG: hypothetical protein ACHREM_07450 [Polyangiales bacterium]
MSEEHDLEAAIAADPGLAAAELRLAMYLVGGRDEDSRAFAAFRNAQKHRAALGEIDSAILDATEPRFRDPPDRVERAKRMKSVAEKYRTDPYVQSLFGFSELTQQRRDDALAAFDRALEFDPGYVPAIAGKIKLTLGFDHDTVRATELIDSCLRSSATAVSCLWAKMHIASEERRCADVKTVAKQVLAVDPNSEEALDDLATVLFALGEPVDTVAEALRRADSHAPSADNRHVEELGTRVTLDLISGDLHDADSVSGEIATFADAHTTIDPLAKYQHQINLVLEEGDITRARALVKALRARIGASATAVRDLPIEGQLAYAELHSGITNRTELHAEQGRMVAWQKSEEERGDRRRDPFWTWIVVYAIGATDEFDAADAVAALPSFGGVDPLRMRDFGFTAPLGQVFALAGRYQEAIPVLEGVTQACDQLRIESIVGSWYYLGLAREKTGDIHGARAAYEKVLARWGSAKPRSVTADRARARLALLPK